jgi:hypothetical protein
LAELLQRAGGLANDRQIERHGLTIRWRSERRLGQIMKKQRQTVGMAKGCDKGGERPIAGLRQNPADAPPTLAETGIDKNLANRARKSAAIPSDQVWVDGGHEATGHPVHVR